jgi:hypothetical protein
MHSARAAPAAPDEELDDTGYGSEGSSCPQEEDDTSSASKNEYADGGMGLFAYSFPGARSMADAAHHLQPWLLLLRATLPPTGGLPCAQALWTTLPGSQPCSCCTTLRISKCALLILAQRCSAISRLESD